MLQNHVFKSTLENHSFVTKGGPEGGLAYIIQVYIYIYCFLVISHTHSFKTLPQVCGGVHWRDTRTRIERELHLPCQNVKMLTSGEHPPQKKNLQNSNAIYQLPAFKFYLGGERFIKVTQKTQQAVLSIQLKQHQMPPASASKILTCFSTKNSRVFSTHQIPECQQGAIWGCTL